MKKLGKKLIFLYRLNADGSGTEPVDSDLEHVQNEKFSLNSLSLSNKTYVASGFNTYIVKLKK
jgi:hypothetical protein